MRTLVSPGALRSRRGKLVYGVVFGCTLVVFILAFLFPLYWAVTGAMKSPQELAHTPATLIPQEWHPETFADAWQQMNLGKYFLNTLIVAGGAWLAQLAIDVPAAFALSKLRPKFGNIVLALMLATLMLPATALLVPTYVTVTDLPLLHLNLINSPTAVWLPAAANAFNIYLLKRFFDQIPDELIEAARMDGAGEGRIFVSIVLPLLKPVVVTLAVLTFLGAWNDFMWPLIVLTDREMQTLPVMLASLSREHVQDSELMMAGAVVTVLPVLALFLVLQRYYLQGLTMGGVKQ